MAITFPNLLGRSTYVWGHDFPRLFWFCLSIYLTACFPSSADRKTRDVLSHVLTVRSTFRRSLLSYRGNVAHRYGTKSPRGTAELTCHTFRSR
ncbi:hypothetical protein HD554DRAFT_834743 [Boletus coccyginus]|nr:hypothetical protein HD554DRAFT_834743 [Boletus coccyginus]